MSIISDFENNDQIKKALETYYSLLVEWNEKINLTAITDRDEVYIKHFKDSLAIDLISSDIADILNIDLYQDEISLADIGTGAGFPGLVIAIAFSNIQVTLVDSLNKRVDFLNEVIRSLDLKNARAIHSRAEDLARDDEHREKYDIIVSRAVARLNLLSEFCLPFVKQGGLFIPYKSAEITEEYEEAKNAINILGGETSRVFEFTLPDTDLKRSLILIKKINACPDKYPRQAGKASKKPIV